MKTLIAMIITFGLLSAPQQVKAAGPCHIGELFICLPYCLLIN